MNLIVVEQLTQIFVATAMAAKTGMMEKRRFYLVRLETHHFVGDLGMVDSELTETV